MCAGENVSITIINTSLINSTESLLGNPQTPSCKLLLLVHMYTDVVILVPRRYNVDTVPYNAHVQTYTVAEHNVEHVRDVSCCTGLSCGRRTETNSATHKEY